MHWVLFWLKGIFPFTDSKHSSLPSTTIFRAPYKSDWSHNSFTPRMKGQSIPCFLSHASNPYWPNGLDGCCISKTKKPNRCLNVMSATVVSVNCAVVCRIDRQDKCMFPDISLPPALCTNDDASFPEDKCQFVTLTHTLARGKMVWGRGQVAGEEWIRPQTHTHTYLVCLPLCACSALRQT